MASRSSSELNTEQTINTLNEILELELAGVVRYMHYSFMIFGHHRIPITAWLRTQSIAMSPVHSSPTSMPRGSLPSTSIACP